MMNYRKATALRLAQLRQFIIHHSSFIIHHFLPHQAMA